MRKSVLTIKVLVTLITISIINFSCEQKEGRKDGNSRSVETELNNNKTSDSIKTIVFFGNSLTAGYGLKPEESFPALIQKKVDSAGLAYKVINAGLSGETTAGGLSRISWILKQKPDVFVLELGANDGLRGLELQNTEKNLQSIIDSVKKVNADVKIILAGMQVPPNMGKDYTEKFKSIYPRLAEKNNIPVIPFLLEGTAGNPELNLGDGIHPNAEGQKIVAANVWKKLLHVL